MKTALFLGQGVTRYGHLLFWCGPEGSRLGVLVLLFSPRAWRGCFFSLLCSCMQAVPFGQAWGMVVVTLTQREIYGPDRQRDVGGN